ncbi:MAG: 2'-5' RNA ligase family protein [Nocardioidaceae bacterium]|nr:2'-5' RNA ligase family protein [Nocardioidaceae bacterium]MCL2613903.1 2'-5' RNA ligase family protein [Nocardioidaceae bacterium]
MAHTEEDADGHTVVVVPVPGLEPFVRARWDHYDPRWVSRDPAFTHAHVTVLAPFVADPSPADLEVLAAIARDTPAFGFALRSVAEFPNGIIHTGPEPAAPFAELTGRVVEAYPGHPPYAGEFDPVPHLTLDHAAGPVTVDSVRAALGDLLPARCRAERLEIHRYAEGDCRVLASWPLGSGADDCTLLRGR